METEKNNTESEGYASFGMYFCWATLNLEKNHGSDTSTKARLIDECVSEYCPEMKPETIAKLYTAIVASQKTAREFFRKAEPELVDAWQYGCFNIRAGIALTCFLPDQQRAIADGLEQEIIQQADIERISAFLWRLDRGEEPEPEEFIQFSDHLARLFWGGRPRLAR